MTEPLTDKALDELRFWFVESVGDPHAREVTALIDEAKRTRVLLKRIEWKGFFHEGAACPECDGSEPVRTFSFQDTSSGHEPSCELAALIRRV